MKHVQAIHIATMKPSTGTLVETRQDLKELKGSVHPLVFAGVKKLVEAGEPVFINSAGGYCDVKGTYRIIGREDLN
jgi:hypothetical protein